MLGKVIVEVLRGMNTEGGLGGLPVPELVPTAVLTVGLVVVVTVSPKPTLVMAWAPVGDSARLPEATEGAPPYLLL